MPEGGYQDWLERERRIRLRILAQSPELASGGEHRLCADCAEVLLCHEEQCPNCGGCRLARAKLAAAELAGRMRLGKRWADLNEASR